MTHDALPSIEERYAALHDRFQALETQLSEVQATEHQAMTLFSEAPVPYLLLNAQGRFKEVNAAASALLGHTPEALRGKRLAQFLAPASQSDADVLLHQVMNHGLKQRGEAQLFCADGTPFDVLLDIDAAKVDSVFLHFRVVLTDITTYKQVHQDLLSSNTTHQQELLTQGARMRTLNQELEQIVTAFLQQLHHPVDQAMNVLRRLRQKLGDQPDAVTRPLMQTEQAIQAIVALLASMGRYMQMRSMRLHVRPVALGQVLREVLKRAQPVMADRTIRITHDSLPTVQGDSQALLLIFDEYVANALKFTKGRDEARIHLRVEETTSEYRIGVEDNGTGFNLRHKDRLFQLFGRLHSSKAYEGTGVGLVTVRRLCELFGGRVWAEGKVDEGATFWFAWPKQPKLQR
ncbi:sensor histidine kinase [Deinococcus sonorensis]